MKVSHCVAEGKTKQNGKSTLYSGIGTEFRMEFCVFQYFWTCTIPLVYSQPFIWVQKFQIPIPNPVITLWNKTSTNSIFLNVSPQIFQSNLATDFSGISCTAGLSSLVFSHFNRTELEQQTPNNTNQLLKMCFCVAISRAYGRQGAELETTRFHVSAGFVSHFNFICDTTTTIKERVVLALNLCDPCD